MNRMATPEAKATTAGTTHTLLHADSADMPVLNRGKRTDPMTICVTPPPRLPHPPTSALAVPTTSLVNMRDVQYWHMTKVDPPMPMKKRRTARAVASSTSPVRAVGTEAKQRIKAMGMRAPYLSQSGPFTKRMKMVPPTEQMDDVQICCLLNESVVRTSERSGAMANQMKKAMKKDHHEQWKARMCGRLKLQSLISDDLSS
mmetsp:Transcript_53970/g.161526  ORF Transcript_53970/g.161526 Transcript_53970/m.161526 type:complete len:201 (-) Transcript_53970:403-1005(-)